MRQNAIMKSAVALALASMAAAASAGQFTGPTLASDAASTYATENFGPGAVIAADNITLPATQDVVFTTGVGISGGYVVNDGGIVYFYLRLANAKWAAAPVSGDFTFSLAPTTFTIGNPALSSDGATVMVPLQNTSDASASIGSGATITYAGGGKVLTPTSLTALGAAGGAVSVTAALSGTTANANVVTLPGDIDSGGPFNILTTAAAISKSVTAGATTKIAVDAINQRKKFVGASTTADLGTLTFSNVSGAQLQVNGTNEYYTVDPAGRVINATATAGSGSFNAGTVTLNQGSCAGTVAATATLNTAKTVATFTNVAVNTWGDTFEVCYNVNGTTQINEMRGNTMAATLVAPAGINDQDVSVSGSLADVVNDGTVIDLRNYVPTSANAFGYAMLLRVINTGSTGADIFAQYIDATTGQPVGSQTMVGTTAAGGVLELTNDQIETALGAPAAGANSRLRLVAPTSSMTVQMWMRTNGTWVELTGGQSNSPLNNAQ